MINKKIEIKLGDEKRQLWFNNFAVFELQRMFGVDQAGVLKKVMARAEENYLLLISDLVKVGLKGHSFALDEGEPDIEGLNLLIAEAEISELMKVWEVFFEHMGGNIEPDKKKAAQKKKVPAKRKS